MSIKDRFEPEEGQFTSPLSQGEKDFVHSEIHDRYQQAEVLLQGVLSKDFVLNDAVFPHWINGSDFFWYLRRTKLGKEFRLVNAKSKSNKLAFDHQVLADALKIATDQFFDVNDHTSFTKLSCNCFVFLAESD